MFTLSSNERNGGQNSLFKAFQNLVNLRKKTDIKNLLAQSESPVLGLTGTENSEKETKIYNKIWKIVSRVS